VNAWRDTVTRGARLVCIAPLIALGVAPVAVFFRPALVIFALWHGYGIWRLTAGGAPLATRRLNVCRWVLRALGVAGVVLVTLDYEGYRALLIATAAAYLLYLSELLPALGLSPKKHLRFAAAGGAFCCALALLDLMLRRGLNAVTWGAIPGYCLSGLALPIGLLAWLELDRLRPSRADAQPGQPEPRWSLKVRQIVTFSVAFSIGFASVVISLVGGVWVAWQQADVEPGDIDSAGSFILLCIAGLLHLVLRKLNRQTLRVAVLALALALTPLWWWFTFPTQFDAREWKRSNGESQLRSDMAQDLIYSRILLGKTRLEVVELLGAPGSYARVAGADKEFYSLASHLCKGFVIRFAGGKAVEANFYWCE
jgi:hypothetical protein